MKYKNIRKVIAVSMAIAGVTLAGCQGNHYKHSEVHNYRQSERQTRKVFTVDTPSEKLAKTVLTSEVIDKLGGNNKIRFNGAGAFIINDNKTDLNANVSSSPYASNEIDALKRPTVANALLNKTTRQYGTREQTHNGVKNWNWKPAGFKQVTHLSGKYNHAYDRGHLLAYALIGNLKGYDASESNPQNIATQTAWANEARENNSTGQNYYEGLVRQAVDRGKTVRYRVTDLYQGDNAVPSGAHIEAKSKDGSLEFNVFVPNVQPGIMVNYRTGKVTIQNNKYN